MQSEVFLITRTRTPNKVAKTLGAVGLAIATSGASLAAQMLYDDNKFLAEKTRQLCLFGA